MQKLRLVLAGLFGLALLLLPARVVLAVDSTTPYGGNNASDYQPQTGNPQSNVTTGLQNTGSGLQPSAGQTSLSQQNLTNSGDLHVLGVTSKPNPNTTTIAASVNEDKQTNPLLYILLGLMAVSGGMYAAWKRVANKQAIIRSEPIVEPVETFVSEVASVQKNPKKSSTNKRTKKKSSKKRKRKR